MHILLRDALAAQDSKEGKDLLDKKENRVEMALLVSMATKAYWYDCLAYSFFQFLKN